VGRKTISQLCPVVTLPPPVPRWPSNTTTPAFFSYILPQKTVFGRPLEVTVRPVLRCRCPVCL